MTTVAPKFVFLNAFDQKRKLDLVKRTHEIFNGLHGKEIELKESDPPGHTDTETFISIPGFDPEFDLVHKHEWQHIFFKTDLRARAHFVDQYTSMVLARIPRSRGSLKEPLEQFLHALCNGLDDIRVASLWHRLYPQSAEDIEERWRRLIGEYHGGASQDLTLYTMAIGLGVDGKLPEGPWTRWRDKLYDHVNFVKGQGFPTVLIAARRILDFAIDDVMKEFYQQNPAAQPLPSPQSGVPQPSPPGSPQAAPQPSRLGAPKVQRTENQKESANKAEATPAEDRAKTFLEDMIQSSKRFGSDVRLADTNVAPSGMDPRSQHTASVVQAALGRATPEREEFVVQLSNKEIEKIIQRLRATQTRTTTPDADLLKGMEDAAHFVDLGAAEVEKQELSVEDKRLVTRMRSVFGRLGERKRRKRSDEGSVLDPIAYFELLTGSGDADIFEDEQDVRGFSALVLLDMSGSMVMHWDTVARATLVLAQSLKFPFSKFEVWGFTGSVRRAVIFRFTDPLRGYGEITHGMAFQATPLSYALEAALRRLDQMEGSTKHLFVLTDGMPTPVVRGKSDHKTPIAAIEESVKKGRTKGIHTTALIIGDQIPDSSATKMFGDQRNWKKTEGELFKDFTALVEKSFAKHLRGKR